LEKPLFMQGDNIQMSNPDQQPSKAKRFCKWFINAITPDPCPWTLQGYLRLFFILVIITLLILGSIYFADLKIFFGAHGPLQRFVSSLGWIGPVVFGLIYAGCTVLMMPGSLLTIAAGVLFSQLYQAFLAVSIGTTLGASIAFLLGKSVLRSWVENQIEKYPIFQAIDSAIAKRGLTMVLLLRLSPLIPFNILNYALSVTSISFLSFSYGSWVGMAPGTFLYIYLPWAALHAIGAATADLTNKILLYGVGPAVTIVVVVIVTIIAKRAIDTEMKSLEDNKGLLAD